MKTKKIILLISIILALTLALWYIDNLNTTSNQNLNEINSSPFSIEVSSPVIEKTTSEIFEDDKLIEKSGEDSRLIIKVSILNTTNQEFKNVYYEFELNPDIEPFIASQVLKFTSDKFYVTTVQQAAADSKSEILKVSGFEHNWNMLLTPNTELIEYYNRKPDDIYDALKTITIKIKWDGGEQEETIPIHLNREEI
ncbi:hypothetical protein ACTNDY_09000 [Tissierellaceae bacterium HCP3S3_D8]